MATETTTGQRLRDAREMLGLSQESLGEACEKSGQWVGEIEKGRQRLPAYLAAWLASEHNISLQWLFAGIGGPFYNLGNEGVTVQGGPATIQDVLGRVARLVETAREHVEQCPACGLCGRGDLRRSA